MFRLGTVKVEPVALVQDPCSLETDVCLCVIFSKTDEPLFSIVRMEEPEEEGPEEEATASE